MRNQLDLSIIVATKDRHESLANLLRSVAASIEHSAKTAEVLVIDNGSADDTKQAVRNARVLPNLVFHYFLEPVVGKANALNVGLLHARGAILSFVDDDIIASRNYVDNLVDAFSRNPALEGIGGRVDPFDPKDLHVTVRTASCPFRVEIDSFTPTNIPIIGCNMAFRADTINRVGCFDRDTGPGSRIGSGDDADFIYRSLKRLTNIEYRPDVQVFHNHRRSTTEELAKLQTRYVRGRGAFYHKYHKDPRVRRWAYWEARNIVVKIIKARNLAELENNTATLLNLLYGFLLSFRIRGPV